MLVSRCQTLVGFAVLSCTFGGEARAASSAAPVTLRFAELVVPSRRALEPSARLRALAGQRVRMVGFMARLEEPPRGAFWLTAAPVSCDETGGGTGDLPPDAVLVEVPSAAGTPIPWRPEPLEAVGTLTVGLHADAEGLVSLVRLQLDRFPQPGPVQKTAKQPAGGERRPAAKE
jgi:hypothetical protein